MTNWPCAGKPCTTTGQAAPGGGRDGALGTGALLLLLLITSFTATGKSGHLVASLSCFPFIQGMNSLQQSLQSLQEPFPMHQSHL